MYGTPKTTGCLWQNVIAFDNLYSAYLAARRGKRYRSEVLEFSADLEENLITLQNELQWHSWEPGRWRCFRIYEPKCRDISAPPFRDRVVHHALVSVVEPLFERRFIGDSFACRVGKGTHAAHERLMHFLRRARRRWGRYYVLQTDVKSYFPSVRHDLILRTVSRVVRDPDVLWLFEKIVSDSGYADRGLPIGALTSQLLANAFLDRFDHYVKDDLGERLYIRYMDDTVTIGPDRGHLRRLMGDMETFLRDELDLRLNPKTRIYPGSQGVDFCGYRCWPTHALPRKRNVRRTHRRLRRMARLYGAGVISLEQVRPVIASYLGYMKHCSSHETVNRFLDGLTFQRKG